MFFLNIYYSDANVDLVFIKAQSIHNVRISARRKVWELWLGLQTKVRIHLVCLSVRASLRMRREEKPTRCHWMGYCTYDMLNMFRALLCPSSGARDYMCVITAYGVQCLVAGCRRSGAGQQGVRLGWGMLHDLSSNIPHPERTPCCSAPYLRQPATKHCTP